MARLYGFNDTLGYIPGLRIIEQHYLEIVAQNAVGSLLNPCHSGLQTVCKPKVVTMVQLTAEQRIFVVMKFHETTTLQAAQDAFGEAFLDREPPAKKTILANEKKSETSAVKCFTHDHVKIQ